MHDHGLQFNAIGAALLGDIPWENRQHLVRAIQKDRQVRRPLEIRLAHYPDFGEDRAWEQEGIEITLYQMPESGGCEVYIGIDVGSTSTKAVVTDTAGTVLAGLYGRTKGDPVQAVTGLLKQVREIFAEKELTINGVATTGSGRELIREVLGADIAINEITAHALGATFLDPEVDTIIEIGGQDSKFTLLRDGVVTNAVMNYVCAAGTGSFIEEQARRLDMTLDEISDRVTGQTAPYTSDRCTVYMERDLNIFLAEGWQPAQIMAAVLYSVRDNYLSKVVGKCIPGKKIYFQGATARNKALVAVFENELKQPVFVSKFCHLTGALGCAVSLVQENRQATAFTGIDFSCQVSSEICTLCANHCDLRVYDTGKRKTAWGLKCGRAYEDQKVHSQDARSQFEREFSACFEVPAIKQDKALTIGIPKTLFMTEYAALFQDFFQELGMTVVIEKSSSKKLSRGMNLINSDFCAPMALVHGLVEALYDKGVDYIFLPTLINDQSYVHHLEKEALFREKHSDAYFCYYSSYAATIVGNLAGREFGRRLLLPTIRFNNTPMAVVADTLARDLKAAMADHLALSHEEIAKIFIRAHQRFDEKRAAWKARGTAILEKGGDRIKVLLLGRPYALFDQRINLGIPARLEAMGFELLNQTMLDLTPGKDGDRPDHLENMHWVFGQQILMAAEAVRQHPDIYPVFLTCFRCSPDAYLINYFKDFMEKINKPYLILQLDEHSSDVGYMTRIEAAADTFVNDFRVRKERSGIPELQRHDYAPDSFETGDVVLLPMTDPMINRLQKGVFEASGFEARVMDLDQEMLNLGYRYATGGECLPNVAIVGSLLACLERHQIPPEKAVLYLPAICLSCNFNQYANLVKLACRKAGLSAVRVMNANGLTAVPGISARSNALMLSVTILGAVLSKLRFRFEPYETDPGATQRAVEDAEAIIRQHVMEKKSLFSASSVRLACCMKKKFDFIGNIAFFC